MFGAARVHPGETNSSWMMKGALQQLLADTDEAAQLRETFVFKVCVLCAAKPWWRAVVPKYCGSGPLSHHVALEHVGPNDPQ